MTASINGSMIPRAVRGRPLRWAHLPHRQVRVGQTGRYVAIGALKKTFHPVVDRLSANIQLARNFRIGLAFIPPQEGIGPAQAARICRVANEFLYDTPFFFAED